mmetsp:Transcript_352/g.500  ORF Transcript_352/g.500 Transcript_352/m.500 type:complete len:367 (-) Transcript_352:507-1607(-)
MSTENIVDADRNTLSSFIMIETKDRDLALLMTAMEIACKNIARAVRKAGIAGLLGMAGTRNKSGDQVKKLDLLANLFMINALRKSHVCAVLVSEEEPEPLIMEGQHGKFCVAFDPLDGSSNIDCNVSTGTIFSIFEKKTFAPPAASDILRPGKEMVAAGYCMYGSATELVMTFGQGVERFILDPSLGEFIHIGESIKMPLNGKKVYSVNEGNYLKWDPVIQDAVQKYKDPKDGSKPYSMRYVGSMVSDVHRTMIYGGIFMYPADKKSKNGKLRWFEALLHLYELIAAVIFLISCLFFASPCLSSLYIASLLSLSWQTDIISGFSTRGFLWRCLPNKRAALHLLGISRDKSDGFWILSRERSMKGAQ